MRRRLPRALLAVLGLGLAAALWGARQSPRWVVRAAAGAIAAATGRPVSYGGVHARLFPFELEIRDLRIGGASGPDASLLHIDVLRASIGLRSLWRHRIVLQRVVARGASLQIEAFVQGGDNIPRLHKETSAPPRFAVEVRHLIVEDGSFQLEHRRVPLTLDIPDVQADLVRDRAALVGSVKFGIGKLRLGDGEALRLGADLQVRSEGRRLWVTRGRVQTHRADFACRGEIDLKADPDGSFALHGPVDLKELDEYVWRTGYGIRGDAVFDGHLLVTQGRIGFDGRLSGQEGLFDGVPVPSFDGHLVWNNGRLELDNLSVQTLGGKALIDFVVPPVPAPVRLRARYDHVAAEGALRAIFDLGPMGLAAIATGTAELQWRRPGQKRLTGTVAFDLQEVDDQPGTPLSGHMEWSAQDGHQSIAQAVFATPSTRLRLAGTVSPDEAIDWEVDLASQDLARTDQVGARLRRSLGTVDALTAGVAGRGRFEGRCRGNLDVPRCAGRLRGQGFGFLGVDWGEIEWAGAIDSKEMSARSLVLRRGGGELWLDGRVALGDFGINDGWDLAARVRDWPAEDFIKALHWDLQASGNVRADARVRGTRSRPTGNVDVHVGQGTYYGIPFRDFSGKVQLAAELSELSDAHLRVGTGTIDMVGSVTNDSVYDGAVTLHDVDLAPLQQAWPSRAGAFAGQVSGTVAFRGTLNRPWLQGQIRVPTLSLDKQPLGELAATLDGQGGPTIRIVAGCHSPSTRVDVTAAVRGVAPFHAEIAATVQKTSLRPFLLFARPGLPEDIDLQVSGHGKLSGPLGSPAEMTGSFDLTELDALLPDRPLSEQHPLRIALERGTAIFDDLVLEGEGTRLTMAGALPLLSPDDPLRLRIAGDADLRTLSVLGERVRGQGAARLTVSVDGTRSVPRLDGKLDIVDGGVRFRGFPHGFDSLHGTIRFDEGGARIESLAGELGGGKVVLDGDAAYASGRLTSFSVRARGNGLSLRYPEGLRSLVDVDLRVAGDGERQWVTGDVDVRHAIWTRRYDLSTELISGGSINRPLSTFGQGLQYDVRLHAPGTLRVDNNLAVLDARAELSLRGSVDHPVIVGRADVERGRLYFRGNTYVIRRGIIDFADPTRIDPFFDIEAETSVRGYRVSLAVNGTLERVHPTLTSDPPLSPLQILNLLAGAEDSAIASLAQAQKDQAYLAATGAASLAAGKLSEEVGLERGAQRFFGLSRFSIDPTTVNPALAESEVTTTARLTVAKRINPDLTVLYARDLGGREEHLLSVEYMISDRIALLLTRSQQAGETGELGFDVYLRHTR